MSAQLVAASLPARELCNAFQESLVRGCAIDLKHVHVSLRSSANSVFDRVGDRLTIIRNQTLDLWASRMCAGNAAHAKQNAGHRTSSAHCDQVRSRVRVAFGAAKSRGARLLPLVGRLRGYFGGSAGVRYGLGRLATVHPAFAEPSHTAPCCFAVAPVPPITISRRNVALRQHTRHSGPRPLHRRTSRRGIALQQGLCGRQRPSRLTWPADHRGRSRTRARKRSAPRCLSVAGTLGCFERHDARTDRRDHRLFFCRPYCRLRRREGHGTS